MADAWATTDWRKRHFAEMLGFAEVNIYKSLQYFKRGCWAAMSHNEFRKRLAHAFLILGKEPFPDDILSAGTSSTTTSSFTSPNSAGTIASVSLLFVIVMPPAPVADSRYVILYPPGTGAGLPARTAAMTDDGPLRVAAVHWLAATLAATDALLPPPVGGYVDVSMQLLDSLAFRLWELAPATRALAPTSFQVPPQRFSDMLNAADQAGVLSWAPFPSVEAARDHLASIFPGLPAALTSLTVGDVISTAPAAPASWVDFITIDELLALDPSRAVLGQYRALMAGGFTRASRTAAPFQTLLNAMGPVSERTTTDAASRAAAVSLFVEATQPPRGIEPYVTMSTARCEIARRCLDSSAARFRPLFVTGWRLSYPPLDEALPRPCTGDTVIDTLRSLAAEFKMPNVFDAAMVQAVARVVKRLLPFLDTADLLAPACPNDDRVAALVAAYRFEQSQDKDKKDNFDKVFSRADYKLLFQVVASLQTQPLPSQKVAQQLLAHPCPIGWAFLAGRDIPNRPEWQTLRPAAFGFSKPTDSVLQTVVNDALQVDKNGVSQPSWGMLISRGVAKKLATGSWKLGTANNCIDLWNELARSSITRREGSHALSRLKALEIIDRGTHLALFLEPEAIEMALEPLSAVFAVFGYTGRASGSFTSTLHGFLNRLKSLRRLPDHIPQKQSLLRHYLDAVDTTFAEAGGRVSTMLASPLAAMQRPPLFLDPTSDAAAAVRKLDTDLSLVLDSLERAGAGMDDASLIAPGRAAPTVSAAHSLPPRLMQLAGNLHLPIKHLPRVGQLRRPTRCLGRPLTGVRFGASLVKCDPAAARVLPCIAAIAPGDNDAGKSAWCVHPDTCPDFAAHAFPEGTTRETYAHYPATGKPPANCPHVYMAHRGEWEDPYPT
ncbi:MAG: hypothetical protein SGPRY_013262, partial [Prymnesium sp.]